MVQSKSQKEISATRNRCVGFISPSMFSVSADSASQLVSSSMGSTSISQYEVLSVTSHVYVILIETYIILDPSYAACNWFCGQ